MLQLGTGRYGYVKLAEHKTSQQKIALKFFPRPQIKQVKNLLGLVFMKIV